MEGTVNSIISYDNRTTDIEIRGFVTQRMIQDDYRELIEANRGRVIALYDAVDELRIQIFKDQQKLRRNLLKNKMKRIKERKTDELRRKKR